MLLLKKLQAVAAAVVAAVVAVAAVVVGVDCPCHPHLETMFVSAASIEMLMPDDQTWQHVSLLPHQF